MLIPEDLVKIINTQIDWMLFYWESKRCNIKIWNRP